VALLRLYYVDVSLLLAFLALICPVLPLPSPSCLSPPLPLSFLSLSLFLPPFLPALFSLPPSVTCSLPHSLPPSLLHSLLPSSLPSSIPPSFLSPPPLFLCVSL
jgi:hypothetical protein